MSLSEACQRRRWEQEEGWTREQALTIQAEFTTGEEAAAKKAARSFKKYSYRGVELDQLLDLSNEAFIEVSLACAKCANI